MSTALAAKDSAVSCPICGSAGRRELSGARDFLLTAGNSPEFHVRYCEDCVVGFSEPAMSEAELAPFYPDDYEAFVPKGGIHAALQQWLYDRDADYIEKLTGGARGSAYELGAGRGEFLSTLMGRGWQVTGQEPSAAGRRFAKETWNIRLDSAYASSLAFERPHDVVVGRYILEHVERPRETLEIIHRDGLRSGGCLFLKLPRFDSWEVRCFGRLWSGLDLPRHRTHFTRDGILRLLKSVGFRDEVVKPEVLALDVARSIDWTAKYGPPGLCRTVSRILAAIPFPVLALACQPFALALLAQGPGRMIVTGRK